MGLVRCNRHGDQTGPLTCDHIGAAVRSSFDPVEPPVDFSVDLIDDRSVLLDVLLCEPCAQRVPASRLAVIGGRRFEQADFPYVAPICGLCLKEWAAQSNRFHEPR
jgi:hypothetical protein